MMGGQKDYAVGTTAIRTDCKSMPRRGGLPVRVCRNG
jgi:hypothetical protein